jgi:hypothetical protein
MPCIAGNYNPAVGVILQVAILPQAQLTALQASAQQPPQSLPNVIMFAGLLDTGASVTCISSNVVQTVGLQPSGKTSMSGSTGQSIVDQYTFLIAFIFGAQQSPTGAVSGQLNAHLVQGCEFMSLPLREGRFRQTGRNLDIRLGSCEGDVSHRGQFGTFATTLTLCVPNADRRACGISCYG